MIQLALSPSRIEKLESLNVVLLGRTVFSLILWPCLRRTGNYRIHEFDWLKSINYHESAKEPEGKTLANLSAPHRRSKTKCHLVRTSYIKRSKVFLFGHIISMLLTELSWSVWENLVLGREYKPHCVRSVLPTSVKILPCRSPVRLIRGK